MTQDEALGVLDKISLNEAIPVAEAVLMLRDWKAQKLAAGEIIDVLRRLRPVEVLAVMAVAERKLARRNRPR
jgi:hypothetical protein